MEHVVLVIHIFLALGIIALVLIQPPESSGLGGLGGSNPMAGPSSAGQGSFLTRATAIFAALFIVTSLTLAILASHKPKGASILDAAPKEAAVEKVTEKPEAPKKKSAPSVPLAQ